MTKEKFLTNYNAIPYTGCHIWDSYIGPNGYGRVWCQSKRRYSHRFVKANPLTTGKTVGELRELVERSEGEE